MSPWSPVAAHRPWEQRSCSWCPARWMWMGWDQILLPSTGSASQGPGCTLALQERWDVTELPQFHNVLELWAHIPSVFSPIATGARGLSLTRCGSKGTALQPPLATWSGPVASGHWSHRGQPFINFPFLLPSGDELKCSTPRARRTGSTTRWRGVSTGSAGTLWPADGLVGDLFITHGPCWGGSGFEGAAGAAGGLFPCSGQPGQSCWTLCWSRKMSLSRSGQVWPCQGSVVRAASCP